MPNDINISNNNSVLDQEMDLGISALNEDRKIYSDTVDLTNGDYSSPEINCSPTIGFKIRSLSLGTLYTQKVNLCVHMFSTNTNRWIPSKDIVLEFHVFATERNVGILLESGSAISKCRLVIYKDGTTVKKPFSYTLYDF